MADVPGRLPDVGRLHDVGVCARARHREPPRRHGLPRPADHDRDELADPRRGAPGRRRARRRSLPRRCHPRPPAARMSGVVDAIPELAAQRRQRRDT